jgi:hypothetical protein
LGKVHAKVALLNEKGQKLTGKQLLPVLDEACADGTTVVSDDFSGITNGPLFGGNVEQENRAPERQSGESSGALHFREVRSDRRA